MELTSSSMLEAVLAIIGFLAFLIVGSILLPGRRIERAQDGGVPRIFKLNGLALFLTTALVVGICQAMGWFSISFLYNHFIALLICANVLAFALSGWLYWQGSSDPDASNGIPARIFLWKRAQSGNTRSGPEVLQLSPVIDRTCAFQCLVRCRAVRDLQRTVTCDDSLPDLHLCIRIQLLSVRVWDGPHLGHRERTIRLDVGLGKFCSRSVFLLHRWLDIGARQRRLAVALCDHSWRFVRIRFLVVPRG